MLFLQAVVLQAVVVAGSLVSDESPPAEMTLAQRSPDDAQGDAKSPPARPEGNPAAGTETTPAQSVRPESAPVTTPAPAPTAPRPADEPTGIYQPSSSTFPGAGEATSPGASSNR
jgi:hypothetical protein